MGWDFMCFRANHHTSVYAGQCLFYFFDIFTKTLFKNVFLLPPTRLSLHRIHAAYVAYYASSHLHREVILRLMAHPS